MIVVGVRTRFFRSFNYDYELKSSGAKPEAWESATPWYPFVKIPLDPEITAIVGANEAGKSQMLTAIKSGILGDPIERSDFCRYSDEYSVQKGRMRKPEFGIDLQLTQSEVDGTLASALELPEADLPFTFYRPGDAPPFLVQESQRIDLSQASLDQLNGALPEIFVLETDLAIPDSVSLTELVDDNFGRLDDRQDRSRFFDMFREEFDVESSELLKKVAPFFKAKSAREMQLDAKRRGEFQLARKLLVDTAKIDPGAFRDLRTAIRAGKEGQIESIIGAMNSAIRDNLNVQRWWSQDRDFDLTVEAREYEIAFTIHDRTRRKYSFDERSQGLRFFLSYFVQITAHRLTKQAPDMLLLDEPDAFLSSVGQQDLLRVLTDYSRPEDGGIGGQVVYVTHSPFLIDKNHPHRIRVLDKGSRDEGTRVVKDAANNRYEPLRSSLGAYMAETAFIGGRNLFVEGPADQILFTGISAGIARSGNLAHFSLDLNEVTVVACGGADAVPYMAYLARGRDSVKPPCVALVDGDESGKNAEKVLKRGEARKKRILQDEFIVRVDNWYAQSGLDVEDGVEVQEPEDLVPIGLMRRAALNYLGRFRTLEQSDLDAFTEASIRSALPEHNGSLWSATEALYEIAFDGEHIEKAGLAREIVATLDRTGLESQLDVLMTRFSALFSFLTLKLDKAAADEESDRTSDRFVRAIRNFESNHPRGISRNAARRLLRELRNAVTSSPLEDTLIPKLISIERDFQIDDPAIQHIQDFDGFADSIRALEPAERLSYQDDARRDPVAQVLAPGSAEGEFEPEVAAEV